MEKLKHLLERTLSGDLEAFGEIVSRFQDMAYGAAYAILGDFHLAEDAAQEAFITAYRELAKLRDLERFPGWLRRIVISQCNRLKRRRRAETLPLEAATPVPFVSLEPLEAVKKKEMKDKVLEAIRSLSEPNRMATTLFYINGYSHKEIADFLEIPIGTVKRRLYDSRKKLKERMIAMVEDELKGARPGPEFREAIMRKVSRVEVRPKWLKKDEFRRVLLVADDGRCTMIIIGRTEELAIDFGLKGAKTPRPLTHDLFVAALDSFGIGVKEARVTDVRKGTVYGELVLERAGETKVVDSRPSDAIAIAMKTGAKVTVAEKVLAETCARYENGTPMKPEDVWQWHKKRRDEYLKLRRKFGRGAKELCEQLVSLPDDSFKKILAKVGPGKILLALAFGPGLMGEWPAGSKREAVLKRIKSIRPRKKLREVAPPYVITGPLEGVKQSQEELKAALDELQN